MTDVPAQLRQALDSGDVAFNDGDVEFAATCYRSARGMLSELPPEFGPRSHLLRATVLHRVAATEILQGEFDAASDTSKEVWQETRDARQYADSALAIAYVDEVADRSRAHLDQLIRTQRLGEDLAIEPIQLVGSCTHGCPTIWKPCGFSGPHC
jgi:hypothetical protein